MPIDIAAFQTVYDQSPAAFALVKILVRDGQVDDFLFVYVNGGYSRLSGFSLETLRGHTYSQICGQKSGQWNAIYGRIGLEGGTHSSVEYAPETGGYVHIQCHQPAPGYCAVTVMDVTDFVRAERQASLEFRKRFEIEKQRTIHDSSIIAYAVFNLRTLETVELFRNAQLRAVDAHISMADFCEDVAGDIVADGQKAAYRALFDRDWLLAQYGQGKSEHFLDFQRRLPGGKVIWVRARFFLMAEPNGPDVLLSYTCSDINKLKALEIMTRAVMENYDILSYVNFADNSCLMRYGKGSSNGQVSRDTLVEENYAQALEWFVGNAVVPEEREQFRTELFIGRVREQIRRHGSYTFHLHVLDAQGRRRTKELNYTGYDRDSDVCMYTQTDITDLLAEQESEQQKLSAALEKMRQVNAAQSEFLAKMSHELRTPLNVIIGSAALAEDLADDNAERRQYVRQIGYSAQYLLSMINDILDSRRMESGQFTLQSEWVRPDSVLPPALSMMAAEFSNKGIEFRFDSTCSAGADVEYCLDVVRCRQIVTNLLNNALKFTPAGGTVEFSDELVRKNENCAVERFTVRDTGCGMSADFQRHMFEPFTQERTAATASVPGTGLGLTVVRQLIDRMQGSIEVKSAPGEGTTFTVTLPFAWRPAQSGQEKQEDRADLTVLPGRRILLVEDHPLNASIARKLLEKKGMEVQVAINGEEGVKAFSQGAFDLVLMDIRMPVMDGIAAARAIRALPGESAQRVPIVAMTANAYAEDIEASRKAGMNAHLSKPIDPQKLYTTLAKLLGRG